MENIYRLRYKCYRLTDMVPANKAQTIHDPLDEAPNCFQFGIYLDGALISTLRLHHVTSETPQSPSTMVYGDIIGPMLAEGASFIDPSRFAVDPEISRFHPQIPYLTLRLAGMACFHFGAPYCLSTVREEHAGFYKRVYRSEKVAETRSYPGLNYGVVLYMANVARNGESYLARYPFFRSKRMEQRMLFAEPAFGENAPLTIIPTAKYLQAA
ncbi:MAG TPA: hypothetical protein VGN97_09565 [Mesorhizobium sp.]|nr:hypothetical protein [Mesorhizobium sp.]